jgi:hypothetical protein
MNYRKYNNQELMESYTSAMDYSGMANKDLMAEIDSRGGVQELTKWVAEQNIVPNEIKRINGAIRLLFLNGANEQDIKKEITSDILQTDELAGVVQNALSHEVAIKRDLTISKKTIVGCTLGLLISTLIGTVIWLVVILKTGIIYYALNVVTLFISIIIIRLITGQSRNNLLVFLASFFSAFLSLIFGLWLISYLAQQ